MKVAVVYWISTALIAGFYFANAAVYILQRDTVVAQLDALGYPAYLATLLPVVKVLGPLAILVRRPVALSDLAYAGLFFHLLLAASAHINAGDGHYGPAFVALALLLTSFFTQNAARRGRSPHAGVRFGEAGR